MTGKRKRRMPDVGGPVAPPPPGGGSELFNLVVKLMPRLDPIGGVREVTELEDVLTYFRTRTPPDFSIKAGLLLRQRQVGGPYLVAQCFLSKADTLSCDSFGHPYGRIFRTLEFDGGLRDLFRHEDLIVFT